MPQFEAALLMDIANELKNHARGAGGYQCAYSTEENIERLETVLKAYDATYKKNDIVVQIEKIRHEIQDAAHKLKGDKRKAYLETNTIPPELVRGERQLREDMGKEIVEFEPYRYPGKKINLTGVDAAARAALCQCWIRLKCIDDADSVIDE